jgi:subtilisin-like proprotein convertase family protein
MFGNTTDQASRESVQTRRSFIGRASMLAAMSCAALGLKAAAPLVEAKSKSNQPQAEKKKKKKKTKTRIETVTQTFSSTNAITINSVNEADPYPTTISVSGFNQGVIKDVNVTLKGFSHTRPDDVDILLVAPDGTSTVLMSDAGGAISVSDLTLRFDDQSPVTLPDNAKLDSGSFQPINYGAFDNFPGLGVAPENVGLNRFIGGDPNGEWRLFINDDTVGTSGEISGGWELELTATVVTQKKRKKKNKKKKKNKNK